MDHFQYQNGELFAEGVAISKIAEEVSTPFYVYSSATLERHFRVFSEAFEGLDTLVCYAVKANSNQAVLTTLAKAGAGADVVSEGELLRALQAGIPANKIVFSGVGKTRSEMKAALKAGIKQFNVESEAEFETLDTVAGELGMIAPVSVRVNPDVDAKTHAKISTGKSENKFGIPWSRAENVYRRIGELNNLKAVGVDVHIGSQLTDLEPFKLAFAKVVELVEKLRSQGHAIKHIDLGGGLGIPYQAGVEAPPSPGAYGRMVTEVLGDLDCSVIFEPGRMIAGNAGLLITEMLYEKTSDTKKFYIVDAAMNDLARPAMYDAHHEIISVKSSDAPTDNPVDIVGPVCESSDVFAKDRNLPEFQPGDLVAIKSAGAYGAVMASTYNTRPLVPEVLVKDEKYAVIRKRQSVEELIALDNVPDWLSTEA
ncbi:diaminopimelate decarboxylase [Kordiimonas laminariae]|uniref:diaminopimelate decarboxylase n=1 Tax=Kordiimonas laminariae TaxID=2917717 RepID=UPI001FF6E4C2|nr:diaminopimelate decarboxylase [Kordiimonas laminariae]MCK0069152.1 diaminopimelate decarboxylase [Kordiimonas laminariae]